MAPSVRSDPLSRIYRHQDAPPVGAQVIEHFLVESGALSSKDTRQRSRRVFDAQTHAKLLAEIPTLVGSITIRKAMGATKREHVALEGENLLIPRTRISTIKSPWRISDPL